VVCDVPGQVTKSDKAKLISRMAKMGQPMLPVVNQSPTDSPEAEVSVCFICHLLTARLPCNLDIHCVSKKLLQLCC